MVQPLKKAGEQPITFRSVLIGLFFVVLLCGITPYNNSYLENARIAGNHLPVASIFTLLFLVFFVNLPLRVLQTRLALTATELTTIWMMLLAGLVVSGISGLEGLIPQIAGIPYFATPENEWAEILLPRIPDWLLLKDRVANNNFYEGAGGVVPWRLWLGPLCAWGVFILTFYFTLYCLSTIIRKQWTERERFAYPLIQIPLGIVSEPAPGFKLNHFFRNPLLLAGMSLPIVFHLINGLHNHFPFVPEITRVLPLYELFDEKPFHVLGHYPRFEIIVYFSVIGITYLLNLEISFSLWVFFLLLKLEHILFATGGIFLSSGYFHRQIMGAYLVFIPGLIWISRRHLADVFRKAFSPSTAVCLDDRSEPLSYRTAVSGFLLGSLTLGAFMVIAGSAVWFAAVMVVIILIMSLVLSWLVASAGLLRVQAPFKPWQYIDVITGSSIVDPNSLALCAFHRSFFREWKEFVMPHYLHGFRAAEEVRLTRRGLFPVVALATVTAYIVSCYAILSLVYDKGALHLASSTHISLPRGARNISRLIQYRTGRMEMGAGGLEFVGIIIGAGVTSFLLVMRQTFLWWPLHPIGFIVGGAWPLYHLWSSVFIGWLIKYNLLKFGGLVSFRRFRFFFLGLILGEYFMVGFWMGVSYFTNISYSALPT